MCRNVVCVDCQKDFVSPAKRGPIPKRCEACRQSANAIRSRKNHRRKADAGHLSVCLHCNCQWLARHPKSRFCSRNCQYRASGGRVTMECQHCKKNFTTTLKRKTEGHRFCGRVCMRKALHPPSRNCIECGKQFRRSPKGPNGKNDKALFCSKPCYFAARNAGRVAWDKTAIAKGSWHRGGRYASAPSVKWPAMATRVMERWLSQCGGLWSRVANAAWCEHCGRMCMDGATRFCSRQCKKDWRGPRQCKCGVIIENARAFSRSYCGQCKRSALAEQRRKLKKLIGDYRKRCRRYGGHYNQQCKRKDIFARDMLRCHVCGCKCHDGSNWNHPRAATVDHHPVPLSKGGDHDWHNVRCACRQCNSEKSDKWDGQRRLPMRGAC